MMRMTDVVKNLVILNVVFFLCTYVIFDQETMVRLLAIHYPSSEYFKPLQIVTHFFMHGGIAHIFFNMLILVMLGSAIEILWGPQRFLFYYLTCALGATILSLLWHWYDFGQLAEMIQQFEETGSPTYFREVVDRASLTSSGKQMVEEIMVGLNSGKFMEVKEQALGLMNSIYTSNINTPALGASGAIFGVLLAFWMYFPERELSFFLLPIAFKAKYFIPFLMVVELYLGVNQFSGDNVGHFAHLGGAVTGFFLILYWRKF